MDLELVEGTTTIYTFSDGTGCSIGAPDEGQTFDQTPAADGEEWTSETIPITFIGGPTTLDAKRLIIERALMQAKRYEEYRTGSPIYLKGRKRSTDAWKRTRLRGGELTYNIDDGLFSNTCEASLSVERQNWWEGWDLTAVQISNPNVVSPVSGSLPIFSCNDGVGTAPNKRHNYAAIAAAQVDGDMPAPAVVRLATSAILEGYVGVGANHLLTWNPLREGEETMTPVVDANASGGNYGSGSNVYWSIAGSDLINGGWFWPVLYGKFPVGVRIDFQPSTMSQPRSYFPTIVSATQWQHIPLDPVRLPPYPAEGNAARPYITFTLNGSPTTVSLDYIAFMPADYWMDVKFGDSGTVPHGFVATCSEDEIYPLDSLTTGHMGGTGIYLQPGKDQRIYFLWNSITTPGSVTISYRPRWRML